jgi:putative transposase
VSEKKKLNILLAIMAGSHRVHFFHLVWSTKERRNLILPKMEERLYAYIGGIIQKRGNLLEIGGIENHIHLLIELSNLDDFTALIRNTKSFSTSWIKKEFPLNKNFAWQDGYGSFSVSCSQIDKTRAYIKNQKQHHQRLSFEQEFLQFLKAHKVKFDERYIFG